MSLRHLLVAALAASAVSSPAFAANAGFMLLHEPRPEGQPVEVGVWYPTAATPAPMSFGSWGHTVAAGAPVTGEHLPLIVMSHGNGGFFGGHADTAQALAEAGFVVAALTHPGDNYKDQSRATAMSDRPAALSALIGWMLEASPLKANIDPSKVGAFGFSSGGFTVLAAAGGEPDLGKVPAHCRAHPGNFDCKLTASRPIPAEALTARWVHDDRIKAVVSAAPALGFTFGKGGLKGIKAPVQLWKAADDEILPGDDYAEAVHRSLPRPHDYRVVAGALHFDFLTPCNARPAPEVGAICASAPGFDRAAFHRDFNAAVVRFFTDQLVAP
ncbi:prolyl oligopeptidase family serine peptidase [Caulobacter sp. RHG1]|uniref:alpha/beta hydrolase family protein n=1 Tax=Caulobacter sp. (strain RHG1) TaxID=2545762 RepID=UPI001557884B|nr:prolyl oligopeptidase family serine peptidase [Caulobacter sp. RHG1]NQE63925.1 putative lipoprotein signal peptide [Caulobacter sp. RHG1]